jgi:SAM-dependent methyltransferase
MIFLTCPICLTYLENINEIYSCPIFCATWKFNDDILIPLNGTQDNHSRYSEEFFDQYHHNESSSIRLDSPWWLQLELMNPDDIIFNFVSQNKPRVVIEIGCGTGNNLKTVRRAHPEVAELIGCDVSFQSLIKARVNLEKHLDKTSTLLVHSEASHLPLQRHSADLVLLINVLHHADDLSLIKDAANLVRPGGTVLIVDISSNNFINNIARFLWPFLPRLLRRRFSHDLLVENAAPKVNLVAIDALDNICNLSGLFLYERESKGLYLFILQNLCVLFPTLARWIPRVAWLSFASIERLALSVPLFSKRAAVFSVLYRLATPSPIK